MVAAVGLTAESTDTLRGAGVTDSKQLTDTRRRELLELIMNEAAYVRVSTVTPARIAETAGTKIAWADAVNATLTEAPADTHKIIIDGLRVAGVTAPKVQFLPKADATVVAVGAASIVAKTVRNDAMLELAQRYPEYGWEQNYGYASELHRKQLRLLGRSVHHRLNYEPVAAAKPRQTTVVNMRDPRANGAVYIGRPGQGLAGPWGNPIVAGRPCLVCKDTHALPGDTLGCYRRWLRWKLRKDPNWARQFYALRGSTLVCFCAPTPCHGHVMAEFLDT
jgi:ribonuclease HII